MNKLFLMASLVLAGCALVPDHERATLRANLTVEYGDADPDLIAFCEGQAPGVFAAVLRPGDEARDYWCSRKVAEQFERARADKRN